MPSDNPVSVDRIAKDPRYLRLVRQRSAFAAWLTAAMLLAYFGFILVVAFNKTLLARPIAGGATSLGIPIGVGVILLGIALTGVYVWRANREFDAQVRAIVDDQG